MNLCFAFAVNETNQFDKKHFGDADKYVIYKQDGDEIKLFSEEINKIVEKTVFRLHFNNKINQFLRFQQAL